MNALSMAMIFILLSVYLLIIESANVPSAAEKRARETLAQCDLQVQRGISLYSGDLILYPKALLEDLRAYWSFNEQSILDGSGFQNSPSTQQNIRILPGFMGFGNSANLQEQSTLLFEHLPLLEDAWTLEFHFFLQELTCSSKSKEEFVLMEKFVQKNDKSILVWQLVITCQRQLQINVSVRRSGDGSPEPQIKFFSSHARLAQHRWTHLALVRESKKFKLYFNGLLDTQFENSPDAQLFFNEESDASLRIGVLDPILAKKYQFLQNVRINYNIDEIKLFNRVLEMHEIQAEAEIFAGYSPEDVHLACSLCTAQNVKCEDGYHICTNFELLTHGAAVARNMGWIDAHQPNIWSFEGLVRAREQDQTVYPKELQGLGLCCQDLSFI